MAELQVQLVKSGGGTRTFTVDGEWTWRVVPTAYKDAADPPELVELREEWELRGSLLASSDGTIATGWTEFNVLRAEWAARANYTSMQVVRDPSGTPSIELTLGPSTYEQFRLEEISGEPDANNPAASNRVVFPVTFRVSAVKKNVDANGVARWEQIVRVSYEAGLRVLEWDTFLTTKEGTSAVTKAESLAKIDVSVLGGTYTYRTNGPNGIDYEILDADEANGRTPTRVRSVSRVRQWGVSVGTSSPGSAPDEISLVDVDRKVGDVRERVRTASARGPGAEQFCRGHAPSWAQDTEITDDRAGKAYAIRWSAKEEREEAKKDANRTVIKTTTSGGRQRIRFEPVSGGLSPVLFTGPFLPFRCQVDVRIRRRGGKGTAAELKLPPELTDPWHLNPEESAEGEPYREEVGATPEGDLWVREATLVYYSATKPSQHPGADLRAKVTAGQGVTSYLLGSGGTSA